MKKLILDYDKNALEEFLSHGNFETYRVTQLLQWIYDKKANSFSDFKNIPLELRHALEGNFLLRSMSIAKVSNSKVDATKRFDFMLADGNSVSAVFLPAKDKFSVCISTQVGCAMGCTFCASGKDGFVRNLSSGEILEQVLQIEEYTGHHISGILFMGSGEPLMNYTNLLIAIKTLTDPKRFNLGRKHITVSTVGIVEKIKALENALPGVRLALSLHSADDRKRHCIIPSAINNDIEDIMSSSISYCEENKVPLTIEYILIKNINDAKQDAVKLADLLRKYQTEKVEVKVNLIPYNKTLGRTYEAPDPSIVENFYNYLTERNIFTAVRLAKGADIGAACGQLGY